MNFFATTQAFTYSDKKVRTAKFKDCEQKHVVFTLKYGKNYIRKPNCSYKSKANYFPLYCGFLFSRKAVTPSLKSSVEATNPKASASSHMPTS